MVKASNYKTESYLAAKNAGEYDGKLFTIDAAFEEVIKDEPKLALRLRGIDKPVVLNQTNLSILIDGFGTDDTDMWINKTVRLSIVKVNYNGNLVDGLQLTPSGGKK